MLQFFCSTVRPSIFYEFFRCFSDHNAFTSIVIGFFTFAQGARSRTNVTFSLFAFSVGGWSVAYAFWQLSTTGSAALFWCQILMAVAVFIPFFYFHFIASFLGIERQQRFFLVFGYLFAVVFSFLSFSSFFVAGIRPELWFKFWPQAGPLFTPFLVIWIFYVIYGIFLLWRHFRSAHDVLRTQILLIFIGMGIGYAGGIFNYFLWYGIPVAPWPNILVSFYVVMVAYAIIRHRLFDIRVIATELLVFTLWVVLFFRLLLAQGIDEQLIDLGTFVVSVIVGILLTRSVLREVEQRERIEKLSEEKSEFMSFASHEIRNPITAMRGYASLVVDGTVGDAGAQVREVAQKILVNGDTVLSLISEFLNKSKVELGQISYTMTDVDVGKTIASIAEGLKPHARENNLTFDVKIDFPNLMAKADEAKLREVVGNLIDNSMKYTKTGGVTVEVEKRNGLARITVSDTGVGIPQETISHLFQKFSRADAQKMNLLGTGLGLFLAKTFIEGMGGKIWAESDGKGKGSRFIIELHTV
jgi:signal transduction histidine kinase